MSVYHLLNDEGKKDMAQRAVLQLEQKLFEIELNLTVASEASLKHELRRQSSEVLRQRAELLDQYGELLGVSDESTD